MFSPIDTPRLLLRRFHSSDVQAFLAYRNDPDVARYQSWDSITAVEADELVRSQSTLEPGTPGMWFQFAAHLKSDGRLVGDCGLFVDPKDTGLGEIGFTFSPAHQGRGLATEATAAVLQFAFDRLHLHSVKAVVDSRNEAAVRLLERLGLRQQARQPAWFKGARCVEYVYVIQASERDRNRALQHPPGHGDGLRLAAQPLVEAGRAHTWRASPMTVRRSARKQGGTGEDPLIEFCRSLPGATEDVKWGHDLVFSVGGKMFAGFQLPDGQPLGFKVDPLVFDTLVGHDGIVPAPYMAKHSWVSVTDRSLVPPATLEDLLADSHRLVAQKLSAKARRSLGLTE